MKTGIASLLLVSCISAGLGGIAAAQAPTADCVGRFQTGFPRLSALGSRRDINDPSQATAAVSEILGTRQDFCSGGAYQIFVEGLRDLGREGLRSGSRSQRDVLLRVAIAAAEQAPRRVPASDLRTATAAFRQARSDLYAVADDVKTSSPLKGTLLEAFDRVGPPQGEAPPPPPPVVQAPTAPTPPAGGTLITVRVPQSPLPPWAVVHLYEAREALRIRDTATAQAKLDLVLRHLETTP